jgi:hypothetical protein
VPLFDAFPIASMAASMAASIVGQSLVVALSSPGMNAADPGRATPMERALIEHACATAQTPGAPSDAHERCLAARLLSLRADFGRDLSGLSTSARRTLDATCTPVQALRGREAYVACLGAQLASLSAGRVVRSVRAATVAPLTAPAVTPSKVTSPAPAPQSPSLVAAESPAVILTSAAGVTAIVLLVLMARRARTVCRVCGVRVRGSGDLCLACRHAAAEASRRKSVERVERQRAHEAELRRQHEQAEAHRQAQLRSAEEARHGRLDAQRRLEEETRRREEDARRREEEQRRQAEEDLERARAAAAADAADARFDPYGALGVAPDASGDEVRAAYEQARAKYDRAQVAHLGIDVQDHYAQKCRAADRAYQILAGEIDQTPDALAAR